MSVCVTITGFTDVAGCMTGIKPCEIPAKAKATTSTAAISAACIGRLTRIARSLARTCTPAGAGLRVERLGLVAGVGRMANLPLLAPLPAPDPVEGCVRGRGPQPGRRVRRLGRVLAMEVDEDLLGHVLGLVGIGEHAVGDRDD